MLELLGFGLVGVAGASVAAKFGLVNYENDFTVLGHNIHLELNKEKPISFKID